MTLPDTFDSFRLFSAATHRNIVDFVLMKTARDPTYFSARKNQKSPLNWINFSRLPTSVTLTVFYFYCSLFWQTLYFRSTIVE